MMRADIRKIERRALLGLGIVAVSASVPYRLVDAETLGDPSPSAPIRELDGALLAAMKAGNRTSFETRYHALDPVIARVFDLDAVLVASVGLSWPGIPKAEKGQLSSAFRRYTVSSYVSNFDSYNGQSFEILPSQPSIGNGEVVVETRLLRTDASPIKLSYVVRLSPAGWRVVDVLTDGSISRVAVQRSDFRKLLASGGVPALTAGLGRKVASLSGGMLG